MFRRREKPPRPARTRGSGHGARPVAVLAELVALGLGVAANLASVWGERESDPAQVWAGGAIPLVLLLATYLFLAHRVSAVWSWKNPGWLAWYANLASGAAILVPVAMASYWHQRELLLGWDGTGVVLSPGSPPVDVAGTPVLLATLLPLTVDGLAVRAALTLWSRGASTATSAATAAPPATVDPQTSTSSPSQGTDTPGADVEPWGGPEAVDAPADRPVAPPAIPSTARVTPMRRAASTGSHGDHEPGWREDMAAVRREPGMTADVWIRRRAAALTPKVIQAGKKHRALRRDVERAEVEQAQRMARDPDDERERVPA